MKRNRISIFLLGLVLFLTGCGSQSQPTADISKEVIVRKANEFIDIDKNTVKFLFKTNVGAQVDLYLGDSDTNLKVVKSVGNYDFHEGLKVGNLQPGKKYYYKVVSQKNGKKAESKVLTFAKLSITDPSRKAEWARTSVFYEIFIRSFADGNGDGIGDFKGLKEKLGYVKSLGANAIWLMPCFDSPSYHGYDVFNYYKIEPDYGTMKDFEAFVKEAHANGIKVILDLVVNHTSSEIKWFVDAKKNPQSPYRDYYVWSDEFDNLNEKGESGQRVWYQPGWSIFGKQASYYGVFWKDMPDLNFRNERVRQEVKNIAKFWLEKGVDGFRLDASKHIDSWDSEVTHNWWQEFNAYCKSIKPDTFLVGENWTNLPEEIAPYFQDLDASFNFILGDKLLGMSEGNEQDLIADLDEIHKVYAKTSPDFIDATFLRNHDMARVATRLDGEVPKEKLVAALLLTLPGTPFLYYGEELGQMGGKPDENIREGLDWYKRAKGKGMTTWLGYDKVNTISKDGISVEEEEPNPDSLLNYYRKLVNIRRANPIFFTGQYKKIATIPSTYGYEVSGQIKVIHNLIDTEQQIKVSESVRDLLTGKQYKAGATGTLAPYGTIILKK